MKKFFILAAVIGAILASCSKTEKLDTRPFPNEMSKSYPAYSQVIVVPPDKDGDGDDTDEFLDAFANATPGTLIRLQAGTYKLGYMQINNFIGTIKGAGKDETIIYPKTPLKVREQMNNLNLWSCLLRFIGGDITITDLTFSTEVTGPIHDYSDDPILGKDLFALLIFANYNSYFNPPESYQKVLIENVKFNGGSDDGGGGGWWQTPQNTLLATWYGLDAIDFDPAVFLPLIKGEYTNNKCYFKNFLDASELWGAGEPTSVNFVNNRVENCLWPLYYSANFNCQINIANNVFSNSTLYDIYIEDYDWMLLQNSDINPDKRCQYTITGNTFNVTNDLTSVVLTDFYAAIDPNFSSPLKISVKNNKFKLTGNSAGISGYNNKDLLLKDNTFTGSGSSGILIDGIPITDAMGVTYPAPYASGATIMGNKFSGFVPSVADIILGEKSSSCTVVGTGKENVVDNGKDNKIVSMQHKPGDYHSRPIDRHNFKPINGIRHR
jgi:hypothetical protein